MIKPMIIGPTERSMRGDMIVRARLGIPALGKDGTSTIWYPQHKTHWAQRSLPIPTGYLRCQELASPCVDDVHGDTFAATGSPTFNVTGQDPLFTSKGIQFTEGTNAQGLSAAAGVWHDPLYQRLLIYLLLEPTTLPTTGQSRAVWAGTGAASWYLGTALISSNWRFQCRGPASTSGTQNYAIGTTLGLVLHWSAGAGVLDHSGTSIWSCSTEKEKIVSTFGVVSDSTKGPATGGSASLNSAGFVLRRKAEFTGSQYDAILAAAGATDPGKYILQQLGHTVTGY